MSFPHETEPDGNRFGPHHFLSGYLLVGFGIAGTLDATGRIPLVTLAGLATASFFWFTCWFLYPRLGAGGTLAGVVLVAVGLLLEDWSGATLWWSLALLGWLIAVDDVVSHAWGVRTPLDAWWRERLYPWLRANILA